MLIQKLQQFASETPDKQAIVYKGKSISYANLWEEIENRSSKIAQIQQKNLLLSHSIELENLLNFLAGNAVGKAGIFSGKHLNNIQLYELREKHDSYILNEKAEYHNSSLTHHSHTHNSQLTTRH